MPDTRVLIGTPLKGDVSPYYSNVMHTVLNGQIPGFTFGHLFMSGTCVMGARDRIALEAERGEWDRVLFWDADLKPSPADFVRLLSHPEEFVCGAYGKREVHTHWHFFPVEGADILDTGLWEQQQAAIGFSVFDLALLKRIKLKHPEMTYANQDQGDAKVQLHQYFPWQIVGVNTAREKLGRIQAALDGRRRHAFNATELLNEIESVANADDYEKNLMQGEDYGFCRLAREAGARIWLDSKLVINHAGTCDFPIPHEDIVRMTSEPWRQDYWASLREKFGQTKPAEAAAVASE